MNSLRELTKALPFENLHERVWARLCSLEAHLETLKSEFPNESTPGLFFEGKRRKIPKFLKRRTFPSFYGVIQVISPGGGISFELKETKGNPEIYVGALLFMVFSRKELFRNSEK